MLSFDHVWPIVALSLAALAAVFGAAGVGYESKVLGIVSGAFGLAFVGYLAAVWMVLGGVH
jgi:hypothetical protein